MLLLLVLLLWLSTLYFYSWCRGYVLFSWSLLSWWQQWWLQVEVLWWWWWSLQWLIGKCVSSCFGHHFLKMFVFLLWSFIWFKKHLWDCKNEISLCFITYVNWKKYLWAHRWEISFCFVIYVSWKKNHLWTHKYAISFFFFFCVSKKNHVCNIIFFTYVNKRNHLWAHYYAIISFTPCALKKTSCGSTSVKYSFLSSFTWVKKSRGPNILSCLFTLLFWFWPSCCSQCNLWH